MLAVRMKEDATKKIKLEERARKRKAAAEVLKNTKVEQPKYITKSNRVSQPPEQSYTEGNKRRFRTTKVMCNILLRSHAINEFPTDIHFILCI